MARLQDLITSRDGSLSLTKLAAATGHALMAASFAKFQVLNSEAQFNEVLWLVYGSFCIVHAGYDKAVAVVADFKKRQLEANQQVEPG